MYHWLLIMMINNLVKVVNYKERAMVSLIWDQNLERERVWINSLKLCWILSRDVPSVYYKSKRKELINWTLSMWIRWRIKENPDIIGGAWVTSTREKSQKNLVKLRCSLWEHLRPLWIRTGILILVKWKKDLNYYLE